MDANHTRASKRLEQVRAAWELSGAEMAVELDVKQPTVSRILNGILMPGRDLMFKVSALYYVPVAWWGEAAPEKESDPLPAKPKRYEDAAKGAA